VLDITEETLVTQEEHKAIARRFFEDVWNKQKLEAIDDIFAAAVVLNGQSVARDAFRQLVAARRAAFRDIHVTVEDQVAEGDKVSTRRTWQATHQGPYRGIAATGRRVKWTQISIVRFVDGRIVEDWAVADELSILQQLGQLTG
jgi:predicted ester cyclase